MSRLDGRVALVTGAASGIGKATAKRLAEEGTAVLITDINEDAGQATAHDLRDSGAKAAFQRHDVTSESDWEAACAKAIDEFGGLDILINNAGFGYLGHLRAGTPEWDRRMVDVNCAAVVHLTHLFLPGMI